MNLSAVTRAVDARRLTIAIFATGVAISILLIARTQVGGDQLNLLARGWEFAFEGNWIPFGNPTSSGGVAPGGLTSLLVGAPLVLWQDHRAPVVLILVFHVAAWLMLDRLLRRHLSPDLRVAFAIFYWLNPWRIYFSSFLWNPNYLFLFSALHLVTAFQQRRRSSFLASFLHVVAIGLAFQLHNSAILLAIASLFLFARKFMRIQWAGVAAGVVASAAALAPWFAAIYRRPELSPVSDGMIGHGFVAVHPIARGILYWFRYASLAITEKALRFDFTPAFGSETDSILGPAAIGFVRSLGALSVLLGVAANIYLWRRFRSRPLLKPLDVDAPARAWLLGYARWTFVAAVIGFGLTPANIMSWQAIIVFPAAVLPLVFYSAALTRKRRAARTLVFAWSAVALVTILLIGLAAPQFRCGGRSSVAIALRKDHVMLHELGITRGCPPPTNVATGWWPDVWNDERIAAHNPYHRRAKFKPNSARAE